MKKREFIKALAFSFPMSSFSGPINKMDNLPFSNENFEDWDNVRAMYKLSSDYVNLEHGYYCMMPKPILSSYLNKITEVNRMASRYMRTVQFENKQNATKRLSEIAGCESSNLIITRNTTESLDMVISGQDWKSGDEAVMAKQDYGAMLDQFNLMSRRYGILNKHIDIPQHPTTDDEIVNLYESQITERTKLLMICHIINITGQVLPVRKVCDMAHKRGVKVMVDGAHSFAHLDFKISDLGCDYYAASLHKWLSAPLGCGILYLADPKESLWPIYADFGYNKDDIRRYNHTGTHPVHTDLAIETAVDFLYRLGREKKEKRLKELKRYWVNQIKSEDKIILQTPEDSTRHGAIANVGIEGVSPKKLMDKLFDKYKIWTVAIDSAGVAGVRVTPNICTNFADLDRFTQSIVEIARNN